MKRRFLVEFTLSMPYRPRSSSFGKERDYRHGAIYAEGEAPAVAS
ncbi:MAG: hypothetical protein QOJ81_1325 [Chloroflexota bacterium]|jgi:hypothetical protein|nr:hypothetical protein [Chloroflexota bacterium]